MSERSSNLRAEADHTLPVLTVGEVSALLKRAVEDAFPRVRVRGEISGFKRAPSGHLYLTLKDADAVLDGVCWRGTAVGLGLRPEDGMEVVATGRLTTYAQRSRYQLVIDSLELAGEGALLKLLEERRKKLAAEGLFDVEAKRDLPFLPDVIGVVTSPTGAVIRDILHRLDDRFPRHVILWPVLVQGETAAREVAAAVQGFNRLKPGGPVPRPDVLIVARGGGSLEDLMAFNEEIAVRAVAASAIPVISAVGHETDTTLVDFAADVRAPTPTAAAEIAVPVRAELVAQVADDGARLLAAASRMTGDGRMRLDGLARGLPDLARLVEEFVQRLDDRSGRLRQSIAAELRARRADLARLAAEIPRPERQIEHAGALLKRETRALAAAAKAFVRGQDRALGQAGALLESFSYQRVLERGFVLVADGAGRAIDTVAKAEPGLDVTLRFHDGGAGARITSVEGDGRAKQRKRKAAPRRARDPGPGDGGQGSLF